MNTRRYWVGIALFILTVGLVGPKQSSADIRNGTIVFGMSEFHQTLKICITNANGSDVRCLTDNDSSNDDSFNPLWSPDGEHIAFNSNRTGYGEIYVMEKDGSDQKQLTNLQNSRSYPIPEWTSNGQQIRFVVEEGGHRQTVYRIDIDGANKCALLNNDVLDGPIQSGCPQPAGKILLSLYNDNSLDIYLVDFDHSSIHKLTNSHNMALYGSPKLSPDGQYVAFLGINPDENGDYHETRYNVKLFVMNVDGSNLRHLADTHLIQPTFGWSPDSTKIAFSAILDETPADIYVVDIQQANLQRLTSDSASDIFGDWSPGGGTNCLF